MSYGLVAYTGNDTILIDGSSSSYKGLQIVTESSANSTSQNVSLSSGQLLFATRSTAGLLEGTIDESGGTLYGATSYAVVQPASSFSTITSGYGLLVKNQSNQVAYQSNAASKGISIENVFPEGSISGMRSGWTARPNSYSGDYILQNTSPSGYYVLMNGNYYASATSTFGNFRYGSNYITFVSFVDIGVYGAYGLPSYSTVLLAKLLG